MSHLTSLLLNGFSTGAVYALVALGLVLIYKCSKVVSFAHGALVLLGAYLVGTMDDAWGFVVALLIAVPVAAGFAASINLTLLSRRAGAPPISLAILTIGIDLVLLSVLTQQLGSNVLNIGHPWGEARWDLGVASMSANRGIALLVTAAVAVGLYLLFTRSTWGLAMRAVSEDTEAAALMGLSRTTITTLSWATAGGLACVAGMLMAGPPTPGVTTTVAVVALRAFPAVIIGGLDSVRGAIVGGLLIGVAESLAAGYQQQLHFMGSGFAEIVPFLLMLGVLVARPSGLFGSREMTRG